VTECPIPPGHSKSYAFHVQQYGSSWYHSHYSSQYGNGIVGAMVVHGPATANYDIDLGPYMITDYYYETADRLQRRAELASGGPPDSNNVLIRGKGMHASGRGGSYDRLTLTPGKKHLLRLINTSVDNSFTVSLVGHRFTVVHTDLVPVEPIVKNQLFLAVGQRYDVIVEANQPVDNYWLNVTLAPGNLCGRCDNKFPAAVIHYDGAGSGLPTNRGTPVTAACSEETGFVPVVKRSLNPSEFKVMQQFRVDLEQPSLDFRGKVFRWEINDIDIEIDWDHPILERLHERNESWPLRPNIIEINQANVWTFWVLNNNFLLPHPIHLHGHDFLVLGMGTDGAFDPAKHMGRLNFNNPVRRDVAQMPGSGWMVIAFYTDNPGAWLLHCHIGWHVSQGLGMQFLERKNDIRSLMHLDQIVPNCNAWRQYVPRAKWLPKLDSGLKRKRWTH
jgi:FtsP/CotA-like multicopper oxidase with cupredoxin domain